MAVQSTAGRYYDQLEMPSFVGANGFMDEDFACKHRELSGFLQIFHEFSVRDITGFSPSSCVLGFNSLCFPISTMILFIGFAELGGGVLYMLLIYYKETSLNITY